MTRKATPRKPRRPAGQKPAHTPSAARRRKSDEAASAEGGRYPVVAVGASAGGLEAMADLLQHLPADTGAAVILLQHLHADRESQLAEILQKSSRLPVRRITDGQKIDRNVVYVAPAAHDVRLVDGSFALDPKAAVRGRAMPIDRLFENVAEKYGVCAVGVVLSGTLSDGALGLRAIKEAGGATFAQEPATAGFSEMPRAAVLAGGVDRVLPPDRIAREIVRFVRHPYVRAGAGEAPIAKDGSDNAAGRRLFQILRSATGVDFSSYRQSTFRRRLHRRMALRRIPSVAKYVEYVRANPQEIDALYDDILITVTRFFRDPEVFETLRDKVFPSMIAERPKNAPIRLWVPGCSTGEEVYSLAISLFEALADAAATPALQIFATDISENALQKARSGEYLENSMVDVSEDRRRSFFVRTPRGWQITKIVRDACVFARQNVAADPPFSNIDLISCRNLLIYLDPTLQQRVFPSFHYALKSGGYLLLGRSESTGIFSDLFQPFDRSHRIFVRVAARPRDAASFTRHPLADRPDEMSRRGIAALPPQRLHEQADRLVLGRYGPPGVLLDAGLDVLQFRGRTTPFLEPPSGSASLNVLKMARPGLLPELRTALHLAKTTGERVRRERLRLRLEGGFRSLNLEVLPLRDEGLGRTFFLVLFEAPEPTAGTAARALAAMGKPPKRGASRSSSEKVEALESELHTTKGYLQGIIEDQEASNEELKTANEELQSTNEELETAKEELQSTNEELMTLNEELQNRSTELSHAHHDLANVFGINLPIVMVAANGVVRRFTQPAEALFGLGPTDMGRRLSELAGRLRNVNVAELVDHVLEKAQPVDREVQDEAGNWYSLRIKPYRTIENRIDGAIVALFDLRTTEQITRSLDYADALVETVSESLVVLDRELKIRSANRSFYRRFRTTPEKIEGRSLAELWNLAVQSPELLFLLKSVVAEHESISNCETEIEFEGLGRRTLLVNSRRVRPGGDAEPVILLAIDDITDRKWAEAGLRASEQRYRLLFETAREGIWLLDGGTGRIIDVNPYLAELLGFRREALAGQVPWEAGLYVDPDAAKRRFDELMAHGFSFDAEIAMRSKSGEEIQIEAISNVYSVGPSRIVQSNKRDLSERNRLQGQLRRVQKMEALGTLAGGVAHDFNNILNIIAAHLELVGRDGDAAKKAQSLDAIRKTLQRGSGVVKQLLSFARKKKGDFRPAQVNQVVEEIVLMVRETFPKSLRIETRLAPDLPEVSADADQLHQALLNLLVNARDAMPKGGPITIETSLADAAAVRERAPEAREGHYVEVDVADRGVGMDAETREKLFEPFFTTKGTDGQGLGLAVVSTILQAHGAQVDVESETGKGTRFRLFFPVAEKSERSVRRARRPTPETSRPEAPAAETGRAPGSGKTILLVEDEDLLRDAVGTLLEDEGYRVIHARDGEEAVARHASHRSEIAAVILDLGLPKLGGWEAFLRMKRADPNLKAIVASGLLEREQRVAMRKQGLRASLLKPYAPAEILKTVRQVLRDRS